MMDIVWKIKRFFGVICFNLVFINLIFIGTAFPLSIGGTDYIPVGSSETISAVFTQPDGGISANKYSGYVSLTVSGFGWSLGNYLNDAFYIYTNAFHVETEVGNDPNYYQLDFDTQTLLAYNPSRVAKNFIVYDIDMDKEITATTYLPTYRSDHIYNFVIDTGISIPTNLHFGVSDGYFGDNGGSYSISISQLKCTNVPEPTTMLLFGLGLIGVEGFRRKFRK